MGGDDGVWLMADCWRGMPPPSAVVYSSPGFGEEVINATEILGG
jgi:hypothetical protein